MPKNTLSLTIFDDERGQYLVLDIGWSGDKYLHATPTHLSLIDGKIWIQYDDTEEGVVTDLIEAGVPKEDMVLGFRYLTHIPHLQLSHRKGTDTFST